jgi:4-hydroxy-3-methylbut-2-enyl diphosphate reductase
LGQTTISEEEFRYIGTVLNLFFPNLEIVHTICSATAERQQALRELLSETDAVIIAGSKESANTHSLFKIAQESGKPCVLIERASDIPPIFRNYKTIGLSAGASTPDSVIEEIEAALHNG